LFSPSALGKVGLSLLEAVIALFLLLAAFTLVAELYSRSLSHLRLVDRNTRAASFASNVQNEIRDWASTPANYRSDPWTPFQAYGDSDYPDFQARAAVDRAVLPASCSSFELGVPSADRALMRDSCRRVEVEILWRSQSLFSFVTLVPEPALTVRSSDPVVVRPQGGIPGSLARDQEVTFEADLMTDSDPIADVEFVWSVEPGTGNATIEKVSRDGRQAVLKNVYRPRFGSEVHTGGHCRLKATAVYRCTEYRGLSDDLELAP
jgi:hypothetical protein